MPYTKEQLRTNPHYQSIITRDEVLYEKLIEEDSITASNNGLQPEDSLRDANDVVLCYEDIATGESLANRNQLLTVPVYRKRYRTAAKTKDIFDREFKEL